MSTTRTLSAAPLIVGCFLLLFGASGCPGCQPSAEKMWWLFDPYSDPATADQELCAEFCHWAPHCDALARTGGVSGCPAWCLDEVAAGRQVNIACVLGRCSAADTCLQDTALPVPPACKEICAHSGTCDELLMLDLPRNQAMCETLCAGQAHAWPDYGASLGCVADAAERCDPEAIIDCLPHGGIFCAKICEEFPCREGTPFSTAYESVTDCYAQCLARPVEGAYQARRCFDLFECDATRECIDGAVPEGCERYAEAHERACGDYGWPPTRGLAEAACAMAVHGYGLEARLDPDTCFAEQQRCGFPHAGGPPPCSVETPAQCKEACAPVTACPGPYTTIICEDRCVSEGLLMSPIQFQEAKTCLLFSGCDMDAMGACWSDMGGTPLCNVLCQEASTCGVDLGYTGGCVEGCESALREGSSEPVRQASCQSSGCAIMEECMITAASPPNAACEDACSQSFGPCHHTSVGFDVGYQACVAACSDQLNRASLDDTAAAQCVVEALDKFCVFTDALSSCLP